MDATEKSAIIDAVVQKLTAQPPTIQIVREESPLGVCIAANMPAGTPTTIVISPSTSGVYEIMGVRSFNKPGEIEVLRVAHGEYDAAFNAAPFDAATYALDYVTDASPDLGRVRGYFKVPWGKITQARPLVVVYAAKGCPPVPASLNWTLFGRKVTEVASTSSPASKADIAAAVEAAAGERAQSRHRGSAGVEAPAQPKPSHPWGIRGTDGS